MRQARESAPNGAMTDTSINKLDVARREIDCAVRLLLRGEDSLAIHLLAYSAYTILFDLWCHRHGGQDSLKGLLDTILAKEKKGVMRDKMALEFHDVPNSLKHADRNPDYVLEDHSDKSTYFTLALAIELWGLNGGDITPDMLSFSRWSNPLLPDHRAQGTLEVVQRHRTSYPDDALRSSLGDILNLKSS
jgi:hypothetical protein